MNNLGTPKPRQYSEGQPDFSKEQGCPKTKNDKKEDKLVTHPGFRTMTQKVDEAFKPTLKNCVIGETNEVTWAGIIQEKLIVKGYDFITVSGISHKIFLLEMDSEVYNSNINIDFLYKYFSKVRLANHLDLIVPRVIWLDCDGLSLSVWNKHNWSNIIGDWGYLISENRNPPSNGMYSSLKLCIATRKVEDIAETLKVVIEGDRYWVNI